MTALQAFKRALELALAVFSVLLITALFLLVTVAVIYRELGAALTWYDEVATILLAWLTYFGSAYAALKRGHLGSPEVLRLAPISLRLPLFVIGEAMVIGFFVILGWAGLEVVILLAGDGLISLPWVPVQLTQSVIPVGSAFFILAELLSIPDEWASLSERRLPTEQI
jgi:TRAP-type C4-dicarboxylate transport system permease small subunit